MEFRRLVVWISAGILGFQGVTLALDLLNCTLLSWLWVERHGLQQASWPAPTPAAPTPAAPTAAAPPPVAPEASTDPLPAAGGDSEAAIDRKPQAEPFSLRSGPLQPSSAPWRSTPNQPPGSSPLDPTGLFCDRPRSRIDTAVGQGLTILAGLALGGSLGGGNQSGSGGGP